MSVRIGIDFRSAVAHPCGISRYTLELCRGLLSLRKDVDLVLYAATRFGAMADRVPRAIREHPRVDLIERRLPARALRALSLLPGFNLRRITGPLGLLHHTDLTYLPSDGIPEVVTVHDLAYEVSDGFHGQEFRDTVGQRVRDAVRRARRILVPSETTRRDLAAHYDVDDSLIRVVPHGADHMLRVAEDTDDSSDQIRVPGGNRRPYFLHVGTIEPRKNLVRLLQAYEQVRSHGGDADLVLVGPMGWLTGEFDATLRRCRYSDSVHVMGAVPELNLRDLYRECLALVYPSLYEGYGLPVAEAMTLGRPVITSNRSSTKEVAGESALLVEPEDVDAIAGAMEALLGDQALCERLGAEGRERMASRTWRRAAEQTFQVYREVLCGAEQPAATTT